MSSRLRWQPETTQWGKESLSCELKAILRKKYSDPVDAVMDTDDLPYLEGLRDAGITDAQVLLDAILQYNSIEVKEVNQ